MKYKKRKSDHRTAEQMYAHIHMWEASGQSQTAYISAHGLPKSVFGYWLRRYRQEKQGGFVVPFTKVGKHRRVKFEDLASSKNRKREEREALLIEIMQGDEELGLHDS